jgi:hypothetical protein
LEVSNDVVQLILGRAEYQAFSVGKQKPFGALSKMGKGDVVFIEKSHRKAAFYKENSKYTISKSGGPDMSRLFLCRAMDPLRGPFGDYVRASSREAARRRFFEIFGLRPFSVEVDK